MEDVTGVSLNEDDSDPAAQPSRTAQAAQPMVVVQYRQRGVPWWLLSLLTILVPICTILVYHSLVVGPYRARTVEAAEAVKNFVSHATPVEVKKQPELPAPLALNSQPIPAPEGPAGPPSADVPSSAASPGSDAQKGAITSAVPPVAALKPETTPAVGGNTQAQGGPERGGAAGSQAATSLVSKGLIPTAAKAALNGREPPSEAAGQKPRGREPVENGPLVARPSDDSRPDIAAAPATTVKNASVRAPRLSNGVSDPFEDLQEETARAKSVRPGEADPRRESPDLARSNPDERLAAGVLGDALNPGARRPLPTKEETEREIKEEAARHAAAIQEQLVRRDAELQSARYQERVKFREELRGILQGQGKEAGAVIDQLIRRSGYEGDSDRWNQADLLWQRSRASQAAKVKLVRSIDLPESAILLFLYRDFYSQLHTRNGPRNEDEVRVRAAQRLLQLPLPAEGAMPTLHQPADTNTGRTARYRALPTDQPVGRRR